MLTAAPPAQMTQRGIYTVFGGLMLVILLASLDGTIVGTALPTIVGDLGGLDHISWVVTAYLLAETIATPLYGKLGDLYGRKLVLQSAIVIFLVGSALCGLSQNLTELALFRGLQGLGGAGLIVTTQAVVGDIVSPRDRGRYQGLFGAVFGISSVAGPLLGGWFTTTFSWRWIFYINIPFGLLALVVLGATLPAAQERVQRSIDYVGTAFLAVSLSAIILFTDFGGSQFDWISPQSIGLIAIGIICMIGFIYAEQRAEEPVIPLRLFKNRVFATASVIGLIVGFALFGSVTYLPLFLQIVHGSSPTKSGLQLLPLMAGLLVTSIVSGQLISRTGRYKIFPVIGTALMVIGLFLLSRVDESTGYGAISIAMLVLGLGLGMVMQILVLVTQNAVEYRDLGTATASATLFRLVGGSLGTAALGAVFSNQLQSHIDEATGGAGGGTATGRLSRDALDQLPPEMRSLIIHAFTQSLNTVFLVAAIVCIAAFIFAMMLPERPLRDTLVATDVGEAFAMPTADDSLTQIARGLTLLSRRDVQRQLAQESIVRAGVNIRPIDWWILARTAETPAITIDELAQPYNLDPTEIDQARTALEARDILSAAVPIDHGLTERTLTSEGQEVLHRLVAARSQRLAEILHDWSPEQHRELATLISRLAKEATAVGAV
jgi:EmrB/QacA subfamily drug resistance transporter